jgi:hypothetical protein
MIVDTGWRGGESGGQVRKQFANFCALHTHSLSPFVWRTPSPAIPKQTLSTPVAAFRTRGTGATS